MDDNSVSVEMPKYFRIIKEKIWALQIADIKPISTEEGAILTPVEKGFAPFVIPHQYLYQWQPQIGGYYVVDTYGQTSFISEIAFKNLEKII